MIEKASMFRKIRIVAALAAGVGFIPARALGWLEFPLGPFLAALLIEMFVNQPYAPIVRRARNPAFLLSATLVIDAAVITYGTYLLGGTSVFVTLLIYPLLLISSGFVLTRWHTYFIANVSFLFYALLSFLEYQGAIAVSAPVDLAASSGSRIALTLMVCPFLNIIAFYVTLLSTAIRERESEVSAKNTELVAEVKERCRIEKDLREAKVAAESAARAKASFLANMSHEVRTPMNGIMGMTGLILDTELTAEQREFADTVMQSATSLLAVLNDILDFSKIEAGRLDLEILDFDLRIALEQISDILCLRAQEKGLEYVYSLDPEMPSLLRGDPGRLRQVISNMVTNAIKFTSTGEIVVSATMESETDSHATIRFAVRDTGIGVPKEKLDGLFEAFTQADLSTTREYGGTGLGLAISKQLSEMMGGRIGAESTPGEGSTFWFTAVLEKQAAAVSPALVPPEESAEVLRATRFLIVDDNATNRRVMCRQLDGWACPRHDEARDGSEALRLLDAAATAGEPYRVALVDMQMPGMNGETLGRRVKESETFGDVLLVLMTSMGQRGEAARFLELGFSAYLTKPVKQSLLYDCLATIVSRGAAQPDSQDIPLVTRHTIEEEKRHSARILLAEDNATNRLVVLKTLEKLGYRADAVVNGLEAVKALETEPYDLVLMDVQMPEMDGFETTRRIRAAADTTARNPGVPIIAMTAHAMKGDREKCLEAGMDDYVSKPLHPQELASAIARHLAVDGAVPAKPPAAAQVSSGGTVLDRAEVLERLGDDEDLVQQVIESFLTELPQQVELLEKAVTDEDAVEALRAAHALKGASGTAGAVALRDSAYAMEVACRAEDLPQAKALLDQVRSEYGRLLEWRRES
jgi:signal transduction histidine kinase/CheY-like chemotaxis protein/HPt (histidine-containing phosphotransfer) domain-containing protein